MFTRTIAISFLIIVPSAVAQFLGPNCTVNGVNGKCITLDLDGGSKDCHSINGFIVQEISEPSNIPVGWPGCGNQIMVPLSALIQD